ncbi:putative ribosomal protein P2 [Auriculariales sp. MPI-PUGE-AT-0066]|nr:putative ribosomal protein P2 [Auriculariales sp. MPI-PUGE-AT-0066]
MRYIAAYLLLQLGGTVSPTAEDIKRVLGAVSIDADESRLNKLIAELKDKDTNALIAAGSVKLASVPTGGGGRTSAATPAAPTTKEDEKEPEAEADAEESDGDFGMSLFD